MNWFSVEEGDRKACVRQLADLFAAGGLSERDLRDRVAMAMVAETRADLGALLRDSQPIGQPGPQRVKRWVVGCVAALAGALTIAGVSISTAGASAGGAPLGTCVATGVVSPDGAQCPVPTPQQERLMQDADAASVAADQVRVLAGDTDDARLDRLLKAARDAASRAQAAVSDAQLLVVRAPNEEVGKNGLSAVAMKAHAAAVDAASAASTANALAKP